MQGTQRVEHVLPPSRLELFQHFGKGDLHGLLITLAEHFDEIAQRLVGIRQILAYLTAYGSIRVFEVGHEDVQIVVERTHDVCHRLAYIVIIIFRDGMFDKTVALLGNRNHRGFQVKHRKEFAHYVDKFSLLRTLALLQVLAKLCRHCHKVQNGTRIYRIRAILHITRAGIKDLAEAGGLKEILQGETLRFICGLLLLIVALFMLLAFSSNFVTGAEDQSGVEAGQLTDPANYGGRVGAYVAYYFMHECFGIPSYFIPLFFLFASMKLMSAYKVRLWKWFLNFTFLMVWLSVTLAFFIPDNWVTGLAFLPGGGHGDYICRTLSEQIGQVGLFILLAALAICYLVYVSRETMHVIQRLLNPTNYLKNKRSPKTGTQCPTDIDPDSSSNLTRADEPAAYEDPATVSLDLSNETDDGKQPALILDTTVGATEKTDTATDKAITATEKTGRLTENAATLTVTSGSKEEKATTKSVGEVTEMVPYDPKKDLENYRYPTLDLLKKYADNAPSIDMAEQNANKDRIITVLRNFGVEISSIKATIGPTVTLYEITPAQGVRINKIKNLEDDIALSLSALGIRIIAPIPGKGTIGIEVPNKNPHIVSMESILNSKKFQETTYDLPIALGKTITNEVFMVDLAKMPHLLVAGATGQGKSVGLNAIITSLLYKKHPAELKFVMVDPKKVEFSIYAPIENHFLAKIPGEDDPIITDVTKVIQTLKSLCQLMDHRYDLLKKAKVRNIKEYNAKFKARLLNPENGHEFMPYIVVIIDEYGDLIMTAGKEIELPIARIAQLARAVGMHMVIATQRPTTNIITGSIKANFPARMAFKVMSGIDSKTILDRTGANQLVGKGDMLFLCGNDPVRVQCAFVDTPEVERINSHISQQQGYLSAFALPEVAPEGDADFGGGATTPFDTNHLDPLFEEAARLIVIHQQGSTSLIQRKFAIGYNRAGRLMDQLEKAGIVGPTQGSKPRDVLCMDETDLENKMSTLR